MYKEYACYQDITANIIRSNVFSAIDLGIDGISVQMNHLSIITDILPPGMCLSCPIDYPNGMSDTKLRSHAVIRAHHKGATAIDLVASSSIFLNKKHIDFVHDIKTIKSICHDRSMTLRVMVDYRKLDDDQIIELVSLLKDCGVEFIFCSTGHFADDPLDNIILSHVISDFFNISVIANGNIYLSNHLSAAINAKLFGVRFHSINAIKSCIIGV